MSVRALVIAVVAIAGAVVGLAALPGDAHACPMCFSGSEESRKAFFTTAAFLTLLPLGMLVGVTTWLRSKARQADTEQSASDQVDDSDAR